jgi:hypothetical protein
MLGTMWREIKAGIVILTIYEYRTNALFPSSHHSHSSSFFFSPPAGLMRLYATDS